MRNTYIYGIRPIIEAISSGKEIDKILIHRNIKSELFNELKILITTHNIPFQFVPIEKLNRITRKNHQGVIAFISPIIFQNIETILPLLYEKGEIPLILILDRITDVHNFGAIARSAECAGVHAVIVPISGSAQIQSDAIKTSAGALYKINVCKEKNIKNTIHFLKQSGLQIIACSEKAEKIYYDINYTSPTAIIVGSEQNGISPAYLKLSDIQVKIPLLGQIQSLNVSVATAVILYEIVRQRRG